MARVGRTNRKSSTHYAARAGYKPGDHKRWSGSGWQGHGPNPRRPHTVAAPGSPDDVHDRCGWCRRPVGATTRVLVDGHGTVPFHGGCRKRLYRAEKRHAVREVRQQVHEVNVASGGVGAGWTVGDLADLRVKAAPELPLPVPAVSS